MPEIKRYSGVLQLLLFLLLSVQQPANAHPVTGLNLSLTLTKTDLSCYGGTNGSIVANAANGAGLYSYSKDSGSTWQNDRHFNNLPAGHYTIFVKDSSGSRASANITLLAPLPLTISTQRYNISCHGKANGSIHVNASGGKGPYSYSKDNGVTWQQDNSFESLSRGDYTILVMDQNGCISNVKVNIGEPLPLTIRTQNNKVSCYDGTDGSISITAGGGTLPYKYSKDNGSTWQDDNHFGHLSEGDYNIRVRDLHGCVADVKAHIGAPLPLTISTQNNNATCYAASNGSIVVHAQGGTPPYSYSNNNGFTWQDEDHFRDISAGTYAILVKDRNACVTGTNVTLQEPAHLSMRSTDATFNGASGNSVTLTAIGGTPAYEYSIDRGITWQDKASFDSLSLSAYTILVRDQNGCSSGVNVTLVASPPLTIFIDSWSNSCYKASNGAFIIQVKDGTPPYKYSIDNGATWQTTPRFQGPAGIYTILVTDENGKRASAKVTLGEPSLLTASAQSSDVTCHGASNGKITAVPTGGTPPYKYSINNGATWQGSASFQGLPGGIYTLLVRDLGGCGASLSVKVLEPLLLTASAQSKPVSCHGNTDGSLTITAAGGTPPWQYSKDNGLTWQDTTLFSNLSAGAYPISVKDANGCEASTNVKVQAPLPLTITAATSNISCNGAADGSVMVSARGGTPPYQYSMDGIHWQQQDVFQSLSTGVFTITVKDVKGCTNAVQINITQPAPLMLQQVAVANGCSYAGGQIRVNAVGGTLPYLYEIAGANSSNTNGAFKDLAAGSYQVIVTDRNGCSQRIAPVTIVVSPVLVLYMDDKRDMQCDGIHKGSIALHATGGILPYQYEVNEKVFATGTITNLDKGAYTATVRDNNGCIAARQFDIVLINEDCELMIPNGFSPNGDGKNDVFRPVLYGNISNYQLQLFNSWGNLLFASADPQAGWDGAYKGQQQLAGTYVWMARYTNNHGQIVVRKGVVVLVR